MYYNLFILAILLYTYYQQYMNNFCLKINYNIQRHLYIQVLYIYSTPIQQ